MDHSEYYDLLATEFRRVTGLMAPGKDVAAGDYGGEDEERQRLWDAFIAGRRFSATKVYTLPTVAEMRAQGREVAEKYITQGKEVTP